MRYLSQEELVELSDDELQEYTRLMVLEEIGIQEQVDTWIKNFYFTNAELKKRNKKVDSDSINIPNDSDTKH